jgi:hypothetical protein
MSRVICDHYGCIGTRALLLMTILIPLLEGCAVVAVAGVAATVVSTTVEVGATVVSAAVDLAIPNPDHVGANAAGVAVEHVTPDSRQKQKKEKR